MTRPAAGYFATALYDELLSLAWADADEGWALLLYLDAIGQMFDPIEDLARDGTDGTPGWGKLIDVDLAPAAALPWLAQFVGAVLPALNEADTRAYIKAGAAWRRGTLQAIRETTQLYLTGTKTVRIDERDSSPYHYTVTISPAELLVAQSVVQAALDAQKPAGLQFQLNLTTTRTYFQVRTDNADYTAARTAYATYQVMRGG